MFQSTLGSIKDLFSLVSYPQKLLTAPIAMSAGIFSFVQQGISNFFSSNLAIEDGPVSTALAQVAKTEGTSNPVSEDLLPIYPPLFRPAPDTLPPLEVPIVSHEDSRKWDIPVMNLR